MHLQDLKPKEDTTDYTLDLNADIGSAKAKDKKEELFSVILKRLNELFITDNLALNYARQ